MSSHLRSYRPVTIDLQEHERSPETDSVVAELEPAFDHPKELRAYGRGKLCRWLFD
jgi:hypothetical protein